MKAKNRRHRAIRITEIGGNVFADPGLPNAEQEMLKAQLTLQIYSTLKDSGMTQVEIAKILGVQQPQVSLLMRNRAGNFSVGRLMEFLTALRRDAEITGGSRLPQPKATTNHSEGSSHKELFAFGEGAVARNWRLIDGGRLAMKKFGRLLRARRAG